MLIAQELSTAAHCCSRSICMQFLNRNTVICFVHQIVSFSVHTIHIFVLNCNSICSFLWQSFSSQPVGPPGHPPPHPPQFRGQAPPGWLIQVNFKNTIGSDTFGFTVPCTSGADPGLSKEGLGTNQCQRREASRGIRVHAPPEILENLCL